MKPLGASEWALLVILVGIVNWWLTTLFVDSLFFEGWRRWVERHFGEHSKITYLIHCHMCLGTWVGLGLAVFIPGPLLWEVRIGWHGVLDYLTLSWLLNGLLYKGVGHLFLEVAAAGKHLNAYLSRY
ncbi:MAG: hypothetical protein C4521_01910 [Actinobacteria bacterium]|nr:MAG: hypothetical protein C4521_01910 [Actinomycetota bacterium]